MPSESTKRHTERHSRMGRLLRRWWVSPAGTAGQSLVEAAVALPLVLVVAVANSADHESVVKKCAPWM